MRPFVLVASCSLLLVAAPLTAQSRANTRNGFWLGFGFGDGSLTLDCPLCGITGSAGSRSANVRFGGTVSPDVLMGGRVDAWERSESSRSNSAVAAATVSLAWYPIHGGAWYVHGGAGLTYVRLHRLSGDYSGSGPALVFGTGYDWRVLPNVSLTPFVSAMVSGTVTLESGSVQGPTPDFPPRPPATANGVSVSPKMVYVGLGLTWH
jgi:Autotransporter beta-domain